MSSQDKPTKRIFVPFPELAEILGVTFTRVHIYRMIKLGKFPAPRRLSENKVAWLLSDLLDYADSRPVALPKPKLPRKKPEARPPRPRLSDNDTTIHRAADQFARNRRALKR